MTVRASAFAAVRWTSTAMIGRALIAVAQIVTLSRILDPADFKLVALALTIVNIGIVFTDMGISNALIRFRDITAVELASLFWLNIMLGAGVTLVVAASCRLIAGFYGDPRLVPLILVASTVFFITSLGQQQRALAEKSLRFDRLFWIDISAAVAGFGTAVVLGLVGAGAFSIIVGNVVTAAGVAGLSWVLLAGDFRPSLTFDWTAAKRFLAYGANVVGFQLCNAVALNGDVVLGGRMISGPALGYYFQPRDLCMRIMFMINPVVNRVCFPLLESVAEDKSRVRAIYLKAINMTASVNFPIYGFLAAFAPEVVDIVLGPKWHASGPLMRSVAIWCAVRSIGNPVGSLLLAMGETRRALLSASGVAVAVFAATAMGSWFGIGGIPVALAVLYGGLIPLFWLTLVRPTCQASFVEYHRVLVLPAIATIFAAVAAHLATLPVTGDIARLAVGGAVGLAAYLLASYVTNRSVLVSTAELLMIKQLRSRLA